MHVRAELSCQGLAAMIDRLIHHAEVIALKGVASKTETSASPPSRPTTNEP
jgi:hypothetical protein